MPRTVDRRVDAAIPHVGIEEDNDIRSSVGGVDIFILLRHRLCPIVLNDEQESIGLTIIELEFEMASGIRLGRLLDGTADPHHCIYRVVDIIQGNDPRNFRRLTTLELVVHGNTEGDDGRDGGEYHFRLAEEVNNCRFSNGNHKRQIRSKKNPYLWLSVSGVVSYGNYEFFAVVSSNYIGRGAGIKKPLHC